MASPAFSLLVYVLLATQVGARFLISPIDIPLLIGISPTLDSEWPGQGEWERGGIRIRTSALG